MRVLWIFVALGFYYRLGGGLIHRAPKWLWLGWWSFDQDRLLRALVPCLLLWPATGWWGFPVLFPIAYAGLRFVDHGPHMRSREGLDNEPAHYDQMSWAAAPILGLLGPYKRGWGRELKEAWHVVGMGMVDTVRFLPVVLAFVMLTGTETVWVWVAALTLAFTPVYFVGWRIDWHPAHWLHSGEEWGEIFTGVKWLLLVAALSLEQYY